MASAIRIFPDTDSLCLAAALKIAAASTEAVRGRGRFIIALSGGSTPRGVYGRLAAEYLDSIPWNCWEVFWGDERAVPPDHADSNYAMAREALLSRVPLPPERIHRMPADMTDMQQAAREYEALLRRVFAVPVGGLPRFDLVLLGMGADGHTASLFPGTAALGEMTRWVVPNPVPQLGSRRLTLTFPVLNHARSIIFLVAGDDKATALHQVLEGDRDPGLLPAQGIRPDDGELLWLVDVQAARQLKGAASAAP